MQIFLNPVSFWIKNIEEGTQKDFFFFLSLSNFILLCCYKFVMHIKRFSHFSETIIANCSPQKPAISSLYKSRYSAH